jgi:hypothetical protein
MTTMKQKTLQHVLKDPAVDTALALVADMVGMSKGMATTIVESGLPLMANVADADPWVFKAMYAQSVKYLPPPTPAFYAKLGKNAMARQALAAEFKTMYGEQTETINRDTATQANATEKHASDVLAAIMPAVIRALGKANTNVNEMGFGQQLRILNA